MRAHVGAEFSGHVTGVVAFGMFVQLDQVFVEGLVHVSDLHDDFYRYDETGHRLVGQRQGRVIRLGDAVRVRVKGINEEFMEVNLEPLLAAFEGPRRAAKGERKPRTEPKPRGRVVLPRPGGRRRR